MNSLLWSLVKLRLFQHLKTTCRVEQQYSELEISLEKGIVSHESMNPPQNACLFKRIQIIE